MTSTARQTFQYDCNRDNETLSDDAVLFVTEAEVSKLQREYRQAEGQRKQWSNETQATLRKQESMLAKLEEDNSRLSEELALVKAEGASMKSVAVRLEELQLQATGYESLIEQESTRVGELDKEVHILFWRCFVLCCDVLTCFSADQNP